MFQIQEILLAQIQEILLVVEIIKQTHAQNVLKEMEQVGVMATVCGRVVAVQQQVNFFRWKMFTYYHFQSRNTKQFLQRNQKIIIFGNRNCRMAPMFKKPKAQTKRIFPKNQETEDEESKCTKIKILFFCCSLNWHIKMQNLAMICLFHWTLIGMTIG